MMAVTADNMRAMDRRAIEERGVPGRVLMDRAGAGAADAILRMALMRAPGRPRILMPAGKGNNGGDAFAAAWHLARAGYPSEILSACPLEALEGDAAWHLQRLLKDAPFVSVRAVADWDRADDAALPPDIVVDGLLGTGLRGEVREPYASAIRWVRRLARRALIVALDLPSGLDADTGKPLGEAVRADLTVTMGRPKIGLLQPHALDYVGSLEVVDIGLGEEEVSTVPDDALDVLTADEIRACLPDRRRDAHKGRFGHVLAIGGSRAYAGAIALAGRAALRAGAGLVTVLTPQSVADRVAGFAPEVMVVGCEETEEGSLAAACLDVWRPRMAAFDAVLVGPGLTTHAQSTELVRSILRDARSPMVLDADAISVLARQFTWLRAAHASVTLTPHPGEMARLLVRRVEDIQANRRDTALETARQTKSHILLKGAGTLVASPDGACAINLNGNPGMATAGSGDVLAGALAALLAQGLPANAAARAAAYIHGRAGDLVAWGQSQAGLVAGDLIERLPQVFRELMGR